ncbi:MAG: hypothetical protein WD871_15510 [Xanthobacteraceae bacterium]
MKKNVEGFQKIELYRRPAGDEVEFVTVMWFTSIEALQAFAGEDDEVAVVLFAARTVLKRSTIGRSITRSARRARLEDHACLLAATPLAGCSETSGTGDFSSIAHAMTFGNFILRSSQAGTGKFCDRRKAGLNSLDW